MYRNAVLQGAARRNVPTSIGADSFLSGGLSHFGSAIWRQLMANWMKRAFGKNPGALHRELGVPEGKPIPKSKVEEAARAGGKLGQRARAAVNANPGRYHPGRKA